MIWKKYSITVDTKKSADAVDIVTSTLFDNGIVGAEIEDKKNLDESELKKMFVDIPEIMVDDGVATVSFFIRIVSNEEKEKIIKNGVFEKAHNIVTIDNSYKESDDNAFTEEEFYRILENIKDDLEFYENLIGDGFRNITESTIDSDDFMNKWKENFSAFDIGPISIVPYLGDISVTELKDGTLGENADKKITIFIEPGNAFGTGKHPTTELCMRSLLKLNENIDYKSASVMDVGCGSGILAILSKKLHSKKVVAIDIDENIKMNIEENLKLNDISDIKIEIGNIIDDEALRNKYKNEKFDIVIANILAPVIMALIDVGHIDEFVKDGAYMICSGIISEKLEEVKSAIIESKKWDILEINELDNWTSLILRKKKIL